MRRPSARALRGGRGSKLTSYWISSIDKAMTSFIFSATFMGALLNGLTAVLLAITYQMELDVFASGYARKIMAGAACEEAKNIR